MTGVPPVRHRHSGLPGSRSPPYCRAKWRQEGHEIRPSCRGQWLRRIDHAGLHPLQLHQSPTGCSGRVPGLSGIRPSSRLCLEPWSMPVPFERGHLKDKDPVVGTFRLPPAPTQGPPPYPSCLCRHALHKQRIVLPRPEHRRDQCLKHVGRSPAHFARRPPRGDSRNTGPAIRVCRPLHQFFVSSVPCRELPA